MSDDFMRACQVVEMALRSRGVGLVMLHGESVSLHVGPKVRAVEEPTLADALLRVEERR